MTPEERAEGLFDALRGHWDADTLNPSVRPEAVAVIAAAVRDAVEDVLAVVTGTLADIAFSDAWTSGACGTRRGSATSG